LTGACAICGGAESLAIDRRDAVPVAQNLLFRTREEALACPTGSLDMRRCTRCGFVWNARFDPGLRAYGADYDNEQAFSPRFRRHSGEVASAIAAHLRGSGPVDLLEIGCGQGTFLAILAQALGDRWRSGLGFDPAWKGDPAALPPSAEVRADYFRSVDEDRPVSAVVSRHVIEHVPDPLAFLRTIRAGVEDGTPLFIETPDVDWTLGQGAFFDLYYEHCSLFTPSSLRLALERTGFVPESVEPVFDGQYLLATAVAAPWGQSPGTVPAPGGQSLGTVTGDCPPFGDFGYRERRDRCLDRIDGLVDERRRAGGRVALWGGGSKGVTLSLMLPGPERIDCAIDINRRKQGGFMPASGLPIVSAEQARDRGITTALVMNPAYLDEIGILSAEQGLGFELVPVE